jgi:hypothetical protein
MDKGFIIGKPTKHHSLSSQLSALIIRYHTQAPSKGQAVLPVCNTACLLWLKCCLAGMILAVCVRTDDPQADKLLLVMEYAEAGPVMRGDRSTEKVPLAEGVALKFFRDVLQVGWWQVLH